MSPKYIALRVSSFEDLDALPVTRMLANVTAKLDSSVFDARDFDSRFDPVSPAGFAKYLEHFSVPVLLLGHLQGAALVRNYIGTTEGYQAFRDGKLLGAALISDPYRPQGHHLGSGDLSGMGMFGEGLRWPLAMPVYHLAHEGDIVTNAEPGSPLYDVKGLMDMFLTEPSRTPGSAHTYCWAEEASVDLTRRRWASEGLGTPTGKRLAKQYAKTITDLQNHHYGGLSTTAYLTPMPDSGETYIGYLARIIEETWA
ncbi:conserved hypothetical protein [Rhodococcus phage E3]|uniref:hypothetical protein n=1 Tax=Rhodococcus phage E3 TaxID=1007869 RepID=UPI0002C6A930|nr:hypothetical protein M176_gp176 [Rhodococcus phage E3]AEQ21084.1 conserved hypothetical protein [Rhodococcus phage E3]